MWNAGSSSEFKVMSVGRISTITTFLLDQQSERIFAATDDLAERAQDRQQTLRSIEAGRAAKNRPLLRSSSAAAAAAADRCASVLGKPGFQRMTPSRDIGRLIEIMAALRTPQTGCPWDLAQDFSTIAPYTLEEAYEVADAIARGDLADLRTNSAICCCRSSSTPVWRRSKARSISATSSRRSPTSSSAGIRTSSATSGKTAEAVKGLWERIKAQRNKNSARRDAVEARKAWRSRRGARRGARRRAGCAARPHPRAEAAGEGQQGRLRLERSARGAR